MPPRPHPPARAPQLRHRPCGHGRTAAPFRRHSRDRAPSSPDHAAPSGFRAEPATHPPAIRSRRRTPGCRGRGDGNIVLLRAPPRHLQVLLHGLGWVRAALRGQFNSRFDDIGDVLKQGRRSLLPVFVHVQEESLRPNRRAWRTRSSRSGFWTRLHCDGEIRSGWG